MALDYELWLSERAAATCPGCHLHPDDWSEELEDGTRVRSDEPRFELEVVDCPVCLVVAEEYDQFPKGVKGRRIKLRPTTAADFLDPVEVPASD